MCNIIVSALGSDSMLCQHIFDVYSSRSCLLLFLYTLFPWICLSLTDRPNFTPFPNVEYRTIETPFSEPIPGTNIPHNFNIIWNQIDSFLLYLFYFSFCQKPNRDPPIWKRHCLGQVALVTQPTRGTLSKTDCLRQVVPTPLLSSSGTDRVKEWSRRPDPRVRQRTYECRCNERLRTNVEGSTRLTYTGLHFTLVSLHTTSCRTTLLENFIYCCLLWIDKARAKDNTYTWVSVR